MHSVYSIPSHSASFRTGVEARSRDRECQPGELEPGNLYTVDLRNETQSKISRSRMQKKGTDSSGQNCIAILPRSCQNPSFARATPSPIFGNHLGGSVPMLCRPHCRHPPDGSVLADVPSHSVHGGFHHLSSPLGKDPPIDDGNLQEIMGIFLTNTGCWTQGRGPGTGKAQTNCLHRRSRPLPQSHSTCWVTHHHTDPIARVTSHSISIANRLLTPALPPYHCRIRIGRAGHFRPGPFVVHEHQTVSVLG